MIPERLYGRVRGHKLRPRQERLMAEVLPRMAFERGAPLAETVWLEVGFGGGEHAVALALGHPDVALIACEVFVNGICSLLARLVPEGADAAAHPLPANLKLWTEDARPLLQALPAASLDKLFLMFPDPWPKSRHAKRRFVHPERLAMVHRVLKPGAEWRIASDDPTYQAWVCDVLAKQDLFEVPEPVAVRPAGWPATRYEAKALRAGRMPLYWSLRTAAGLPEPKNG